MPGSDPAEAQYQLGRLALDRGQSEEALEHIGQAILLDDREPKFHRTLAAVHFSLGHWSEAAASSRRALELDPRNKDDWNRLGLARKELGDLADAARCFDRALQLAPGSAASLANAAAVRRDLGEIDESLALYRRAREIVPGNAGLLSAYLFTLNLSTRPSREEIFREHLEYDRLLGGRRSERAPVRKHAADGKLRIGYLSPDLRFHAVSFFIEPVLAHHDRNQFEVSCYYVNSQHDGMSHRLRQLSDHWVDCAAWPTSDIVRRIQADGIDILVDLAGHTAGNRIDVLAEEPAPVIASWLGYLNTTGLKCIDYRITDRHTDPPGRTERFHTETLIRLPETLWCRQKPDSLVEVGPLPAARHGAIRFGSFNRRFKLSPEVLALWALVLQRIPRSTLLFAGVGPDQQENVRLAMVAAGVDAARLEFFDRLSMAKFHELHHRVDIALDSYPYSGATTTFDSLWMGVPVLTLTGEAPMSRSTASILVTLGMGDWIARSNQEFVELAARHAGDLATLATLRAGLRGKLENSILMDGSRFTGQLEELYRQMWRERGAAGR
jgi:predicted O-linked N-acetylglucosamine transferase (SPINDLY family)